MISSLSDVLQETLFLFITRYICMACLKVTDHQNFGGGGEQLPESIVHGKKVRKTLFKSATTKGNSSIGQKIFCSPKLLNKNPEQTCCPLSSPEI